MSASTAPASKSGLYADPREDWLAQHSEEIIDPARPIVDPHHHLWDRGGLRYLIEDMAADIASGHNVIATVYVDCRSMYRANGPEAFRPVGEVEFANGVAAMSASGGYGKAQINAGIVSHANLLLGDAAKGVLEAEIVAGNGRFRSIRHSSAWDAEPDVAGREVVLLIVGRVVGNVHLAVHTDYASVDVDRRGAVVVKTGRAALENGRDDHDPRLLRRFPERLRARPGDRLRQVEDARVLRLGEVA